MFKGKRKPRKIRPQDKHEGYDSKLEYDLHHSVLREWEAHSDKISYVIPKHYLPDFVKEIDGIIYLLEAKGRFWD
jgi:hypothetical protein